MPGLVFPVAEKSATAQLENLHGGKKSHNKRSLAEAKDRWGDQELGERKQNLDFLTVRFDFMLS